MQGRYCKISCWKSSLILNTLAYDPVNNWVLVAGEWKQYPPKVLTKEEYM